MKFWLTKCEPTPNASGEQRPARRWVMVIDLRKCNGCQSCVVNCQQANGWSAHEPWRQVPERELKTGSTWRRLFMPSSCMHCANPPCQEVCPSGATYQRDDGIVDIDPALCLGCGYCVVACPYEARIIASDRGPAGVSGTCVKCNFCRPKLDAGLAAGLLPGVDPEATPACVNACLPGAMHFGDANDPQSTVSQLLREHPTHRVHEGLGTEPALHYIVD